MSQQSEEIKDLAAALAKTQAEIKGAVKDSANPFFKSSYADLQSVWDACRAPLTKNGLSVTQPTDILADGRLVLCTTLMHLSGQWVRGIYPINPIKNDPQGIGSATTYARRYALAALVGVYQTDDDGESAMGRNGPGVHPQQPEDGDGVPKDSGYRIPFGKYQKRAIEEIALDDLRGYVNFIEKKAEKDRKPITGQVLEFVERASDYIASFENGNLEPGGNG